MYFQHPPPPPPPPPPLQTPSTSSMSVPAPSPPAVPLSPAAGAKVSKPPKRQHQHRLHLQLKRSKSMNTLPPKKAPSAPLPTAKASCSTSSASLPASSSSSSSSKRHRAPSTLTPSSSSSHATNHKLRQSVSSSALPPPAGAGKDDAKRLRCDHWIIKYHDVWSRLTLSSFYKDMENKTLSPSQYARWLVDRTSISITVVEATTRASEMLRMRCGKTLPLLKIARENAEFLAQYTVLNGFDIHSDFKLSHAAKRLVDLIQSTTAPGSSLPVAITSVWAHELSCWQSWTLCSRRSHVIPPHFSPIVTHLARGDAIAAIVDSQSILDELLNEDARAHAQQEGQKKEKGKGAAMTALPPSYEKAEKTFEEIVTRACAILDHTLYMGDGNHVPLCTCGRKGHLPSQCTFKSHI